MDRLSQETRMRLMPLWGYLQGSTAFLPLRQRQEFEQLRAPLFELIFKEAQPEPEAEPDAEDLSADDIASVVQRLERAESLMTRLSLLAREIDEAMGNFGQRPPQVDKPMRELRAGLADAGKVLRGET